MNDKRPGEWLWEEWDGEGFIQNLPSSVVYVTYENVDISEELVRRALASRVQRDGVFDSLLDSFGAIQKSIESHGFCGFTEGEKYPEVTDEFGETVNGDETDYLSEATWVEIPV